MDLGPWIQLYSGNTFLFNNFVTGDFLIEDIAASLSKLCRFGGHCSRFYSVAEHSVWTALLLPYHLRLEGLMHDAAEAYIGDIVAPLKHCPELRGVIQGIERPINRRLSVRFSLRYPLPGSVEVADEVMLATEWSQLMKDNLRWKPSRGAAKLTLKCLTPPEAERLFLRAFERWKR